MQKLRPLTASFHLRRLFTVTSHYYRMRGYGSGHTPYFFCGLFCFSDSLFYCPDICIRHRFCVKITLGAFGIFIHEYTQRSESYHKDNVRSSGILCRILPCTALSLFYVYKQRQHIYSNHHGKEFRYDTEQHNQQNVFCGYY